MNLTSRRQYQTIAINNEPWEPLPGMVKRRCERCEFWFATPADAQRAKCPDCDAIPDPPPTGDTPA